MHLSANSKISGKPEVTAHGNNTVFMYLPVSNPQCDTVHRKLTSELHFYHDIEHLRKKQYVRFEKQ